MKNWIDEQALPKFNLLWNIFLSLSVVIDSYANTVVLAGIYGLSELVEHRFKYLLPFSVSTQQSSDRLMRMLFCLSTLQLLMFIFSIHLVLLLL